MFIVCYIETYIIHNGIEMNFMFNVLTCMIQCGKINVMVRRLFSDIQGCPPLAFLTSMSYRQTCSSPYNCQSNWDIVTVIDHIV
jgi:hypothetical protein